MRSAVIITLISVLIPCFSCKHREVSYPSLPELAGEGSYIAEPGSLKIGSEKYRTDLGSVMVPENRSKPGSRPINIPFLRIRSQSENPAEPVFALAGGPGSSNMKWDWEKARDLLDEHDFIVVGYRGVDGLSRLDCPEIVSAFKDKGDPLSEEYLRNIGQGWIKSADRISEGTDIEGYTIIETIEDNETIRGILGYEKINLLSESYGTRIAYLYGVRYPLSILRSAMISVNPPGHFVWEPRMTDAQLRYYSQLWSKDPLMSQKCADLYLTMKAVLDDMPERWIVSINKGKVKVVTFPLLFHRSTAAAVFDAYVSASQGDASGLALMSLAFDYILPSMITWGDLASKAVGADFDSTRDYNKEMDASQEFPLGSPLSKVLWGSLDYGTWPAGTLPEEYKELQPSEVETLLLSGNIDFSTPLDYARDELLPVLKNGKQLIFSECGHVNDIWYNDIEDTRLILSSFYNSGIADTTKHSYKPMNFNVKLGFPIIARLIVGITVLIIFAILIFLVQWLTRKKRFIHLIRHNHERAGTDILQ